MNTKRAKEPPVIIGIAGGTGSGKTTVAMKVRDVAPVRSVEIIHHDSYYHHKPELSFDDRAKINYDHPNAFDTALLVDHIGQLKAGNSVEAPIYDYATHSRVEDTRLVEPADVIFIEGILVLESEALRNLMDIRLYIGVDPDERFIRRMQRDVKQRGRSLDSVVNQYLNVVRPMHQQFVNPTKKFAHLIIPEGGHNSVAIDLIATKISNILRDRQQS
ncbi:MAG: uridine kinase [bacterium]|nr:uridine kinase [bacterium]MCP4799032.1 uridine kinase [bacterium]